MGPRGPRALPGGLGGGAPQVSGGSGGAKPPQSRPVRHAIGIPRPVAFTTQSFRPNGAVATPFVPELVFFGISGRCLACAETTLVLLGDTRGLVGRLPAASRAQGAQGAQGGPGGPGGRGVPRGAQDRATGTLRGKSLFLRGGFY